MFKKIALLLALSFSVNGKEFSEQIIHIQPVSWDELQLLQLDSLKTAEELNLSKKCPTELAGFEQLEPEKTFFKEILWTHYFWTVFKDKTDQKCLVKHDGFDFFSKKDSSIPDDVTETPEYEILNTQQARVLLSASESIGFDEKGIESLKRHIHYHNQAVQEAKFSKYGGSVRMSQFMMQNPRETIYIPEDDEDRKFVDSNGVISYKTKSLIEVFESKYTQKTLSEFAKKIEEENKLNKQDSIYPFNSFEDLLEQSRIDTKVKKKNSLDSADKQSSYIYPKSNSDIAHDNGNGTYTPIYPYSSIGYLQNADYCGGVYAGTDFIITSFVSLTAAHNVICNNNRSQNSFSYPGALKAGSNLSPPFGGFFAENVIQSYLYNSSDSLDYRAQFDYGALRSLEPFTFVNPIILQMDLSTNDVTVVGFPR